MYYVRRLVSDSHQVNDLLQEVWLEVWRTLGRLESPGAFRVWLYRIAHHRAVSHLRRQTVIFEACEERGQRTGDSEAVSELELLDNVELVHFALAKLSFAHREVMTLRFLEEMDVSDISRVMECSEGTTKSRLHYAKAALRRLIDEERGYG